MRAGTGRRRRQGRYVRLRENRAIRERVVLNQGAWAPSNDDTVFTAELDREMLISTRHDLEIRGTDSSTEPDVVVALSILQVVVAVPEVEYVGVVTRAADNNVVAGSADQRVVAIPT